MITYAGSITYFQEHARGDVWTGARETACTAAITHARRMLARAMGRALDDDEDAYEEGDQVRDEYAVYEQALWLIENGVIANGEGSAAGAVLVGDGGDPDKPRQRDPRPYSPAAMAWLGCMGVMMSRG